MKIKEANNFKCAYDRNGYCQLYGLSCQKAEACELEMGCITCAYMMRKKDEIPCSICDEKTSRKGV